MWDDWLMGAVEKQLRGELATISFENPAWGCRLAMRNEVSRVRVIRVTFEAAHPHRRKAQNRLIFRRVLERNDGFAYRAINDVVPRSSFLQVRSQVGNTHFLLPLNLLLNQLIDFAVQATLRMNFRCVVLSDF
jgi:hypothetical protein